LVNTLPISVVLPCYRCGKTIQRAIDSLVRQLVVPVEVILVDDFSNDGTLEFLEKLTQRYPLGWIKVISLLCNGGPGVARNEGVRRASQPYIAFLDTDDAWHMQKASIQYQWMSLHPEVMLTGHPSVRYCCETESKTFSKILKWENISPFRLLFSNVFSPRSIMFRREMPILFDSSKRYMEDHWWLMKVAFSGYTIVEFDLPLSFTFKADFGEEGLSSNMWEMEKSELDNYWQLCQLGHVPKIFLLIFWIYSLLKYLRRITVTQWRRFSVKKC
jgi:glycosyltransferase involved in cell wall biosynthesis